MKATNMGNGKENGCEAEVWGKRNMCRGEDDKYEEWDIKKTALEPQETKRSSSNHRLPLSSSKGSARLQQRQDVISHHPFHILPQFKKKPLTFCLPSGQRSPAGAFHPEYLTSRKRSRRPWILEDLAPFVWTSTASLSASTHPKHQIQSLKVAMMFSRLFRGTGLRHSLSVQLGTMRRDSVVDAESSTRGAHAWGSLVARSWSIADTLEINPSNTY